MLTQRRMLRALLVTNPLNAAFTALSDVLAKRPAEEILFDWFRSRRLVGELLGPDQAQASRGASRDRSRLPGASGEARQTAARPESTRCLIISARFFVPSPAAPVVA